jgi:hypothetical protein
MTAHDYISRFSAPAYSGESQEHADAIKALDRRIETLMTDCGWWTAEEIRFALRLHPETDVLRRVRSARVRWAVEKRQRHGRVWEYRLQVKKSRVVSEPETPDATEEGGRR